MSTIATTLLATSASPLEVQSGFPTFTTSIQNAVAYDKAFTVVDWSDKKKVLGVTIWKAAFTVTGRLFIGVAGPAYAVTMQPSVSYTDGTVTTTTTTNGNTQTVTKHLPRTVKFDSIAQQEVYGGFLMGIWMYVSVATSGEIVGKKWDTTAETQFNLLDVLLQAGLLISYYVSGDEADATSEAASLLSTITGKVKGEAKYVGLSDAIGALDGKAESFFDSKTSGIDGSSGVSIDPTCEIDVNLISFVPGLAEISTVLKVLGLTTMIGPYVNVHFPITTKVTQLSVNGQSGNVTSYSPLTADVGPTVSATGAVGSTTVADPTVTAPSTIGVTLSAVPGVDLEVGFEASISYGKYFNKTWKVDVSADLTSTIRSQFGTIPTNVVNTLTNTVGSTSASTVTRT